MSNTIFYSLIFGLIVIFTVCVSILAHNHFKLFQEVNKHSKILRHRKAKAKYMDLKLNARTLFARL